jgi:hypothetical protein
MITTYFENIRINILSELLKAEKNIVVAVYWFTNEELFDTLYKKLQDGILVDLIIHNDFINNRTNGLPFQKLIDVGCNFYFSDSNNPMHNKFCVIDEKILINGSYNWTYYAEDKNRENILIIENEDDVIKSFVDEFNRLKGLTQKLDKIDVITKYEIGINDEFNHKEYLAQDILYKAKSKNDKELIKEAFELVPDNVEIQKLADKLDLLDKKILKFDIGLSLENDGIKYLAKKGDKIPSIFSTIVRTSSDNQTKSRTDIVYGVNSKASLNNKLINFEFDDIPPLPKGKAEIKFIFSIDKEGNIIIEQLCLSNGKKMIKNIKNVNLIQ